MSENKYSVLAYYINKGDYTKAEKFIKDELTKNPEDEQLHSYLAIIYLDTLKKNDSKREIDLLLGKNPENPYNYYLAYRYFILIGHAYNARKAIKEALRLDPEDADYFGALGLLDIGMHFYDTALDAAQKGLAIDPHHKTCMQVRTEALKFIGNKQQVKQSVDDLLSEHPDSGGSHFDAGKLCLSNGSFSEAANHFLTALQRNPTNRQAKKAYVTALRGEVSYLNILYRSVDGINYFYARFNIAFFVLFIMLWQVFRVTFNLSWQTHLEHNLVWLGATIAYALLLPYYVQYITDYLIFKKGKGNLLFGPNKQYLLRVAIWLFAISIVLLILSCWIHASLALIALFMQAVPAVWEMIKPEFKVKNKRLRNGIAIVFGVVMASSMGVYYANLYPQGIMISILFCLLLPRIFYFLEENEWQ